jgi:iron only hydrogenase large subunit-like protein
LNSSRWHSYFFAKQGITETTTRFLRSTPILSAKYDFAIAPNICCPGWVNFFEHNFPDLLDVPSTAKSPQQMFGAIAKSYFADKIGVDRKNLVVVSVMPCLAKKYECQRDEFKVNEILVGQFQKVDVSLLDKMC